MKLTDMLRAKNKPPNENESNFATQADKIPHIVQGEVRTLAVERISPNPFQPRTKFDQDTLEELANSIATHGLLHPIIVRLGVQGYEVIAGERRLRACKLLGWSTIPAVIKQMDDRGAAEMALIENLQRRDLHFFEEAEGYNRLLADFNLTQEELAKRIGKSQSSIANRLRLLKLDKNIRDIISREMISERHARALLKLDSDAKQQELLEIIIAEKLSVRQTEELIKKSFVEADSAVEPSKQQRKIIFKDIRLFTNSVKKLTNSLTDSGLEIDYLEDEDEDFYRVTVVIKKPEGRDE